MSELNGVEVEEMDAIPDTGEGPDEETEAALEQHFAAIDADIEAGVVRTPFGEMEFAPPEPDDEAAESEDEGPPEEELKRDMHSIAVEKAMQELFAVQDRLEAATEDHAEKAEIAKTAKKRVESLQEDLSFATRRLREARNENEPDPGRYPLLDGPKAEINAQFSKPEAIAPLPADDWDEFYRRKARDTRFDSMGLKKATLKALAELGLNTVDEFGIKSRALGEAQADLTTLSGITEKRLEEISEAIIRISGEWKAEWDATQAPAPAEAVTDSPVEADPETAEAVAEEAIDASEGAD